MRGTVSYKHCLRAGRNVEKLERAVKILNRPTTGPLAVLVWLTLSVSPNLFTTKEAGDLYRRLGYKPFSGYPLTRA